MERFSNKISKFGSLISLFILSAMVIFFINNFPVFMGSGHGQLFSMLWVGIAIIMLISHINRLLVKRRQPAVILSSGPKDARTRKNTPRVRALQG